MFNIVYTPGTVTTLSFFVWSLLEHSEASFRLVSNACGPAETLHLRKICDRSPRLDHYALPTQEVWSHGRALNHLQAAERSERFCFMDSDIFATAAFLSPLVRDVGRCSAAFSATPIWVKDTETVLPADFRHVPGTFARSETGLVLGGTYFAIYDNDALTSCRRSSGVGFEASRWEDLAEPVRRRLLQTDTRRSTYDTGKVLNIVLSSLDADLIWIDNPALCHIGGISFQVERARRPRRARDRLYASLAGSPLRSFVSGARRQRAIAAYRRTYRDSPPAEFALNAAQRTRHRNPIREYLLRLLDALHRGEPLPQRPRIADNEIARKFDDAIDRLLAVHSRYGGGASVPPDEREEPK